jgi:glycopeptide antibiotics resistance protein
MIQLWRIFGDVVPLFLVIVLVVVPLSIWQFRHKKAGWKQWFKKIPLSLTIIAILLITIFPLYYSPEQPRVLNLIPFVGMYNLVFYSVDMTVPIRNVLLNILLFVPFGFFLSWNKRVKNQLTLIVTVTGLLLSLLIEVLQYAFPMGRSADIDDVILNTLGTFLGVSYGKHSQNMANNGGANIMRRIQHDTIFRLSI